MLFLGSTDMLRVGKLKEARDLLDTMPCKNVGAQTAMISGYLLYGIIDEARQNFDLISTLRCLLEHNDYSLCS